MKSSSVYQDDVLWCYFLNGALEDSGDKKVASISGKLLLLIEGWIMRWQQTRLTFDKVATKCYCLKNVPELVLIYSRFTKTLYAYVKGTFSLVQDLNRAELINENCKILKQLKLN